MHASMQEICQEIDIRDWKISNELQTSFQVCNNSDKCKSIKHIENRNAG